MDLHDDNYFGLTMIDRAKLFGEPKVLFKKATKDEYAKNKAHIEKIKRKKFQDDIAAEKLC